MTLAMLGQLLADEEGDFTTALSHLHQSLEILQRLESPNAQVVREFIERVQRMIEDEDRVRGGDPKKENASKSPLHSITLSPFLIIAAIVLLTVGVFAFKLQRSSFTHNRPNHNLLPK
ncbi:hypothetical protein WA1_25210 [Scytonema hofmannii PCC 7110]|uniref:Uncharacterized protein n=1 Tax=Scytonema hofmannii PCC 7110 TaxID=128403 RepID=A0A139X886_9CYAN|nr:hypothetical protein WA1_25210 [Scytonema hofmannii PCC 7110]